MNSETALSSFEDAIDQVGGEASFEALRLDPEHAARLAELFQTEHKKVVRFLVAKTGSWAEARDVAAQAFTQLLTIKEPQNVRQMAAYVYKMASNIAHDRHRFTAIRRRIHKDSRHEFPTTTPSPEPLAVEAERMILLQKAIGNLDAVLRTTIRLRFWDGKSSEEIAKFFRTKGINVDDRTVRRWIAKALRQCEQSILDEEGERTPS